MKLKIVIVDDEENSRELVLKLIQSNIMNSEVVGVASNVDEAEQIINDKQPNLVLLDIEMPYASGFDLLKRFHKPLFRVVFITGFDKYALNAIKCNALDYILKPIITEELLLAIEKCRETLTHKNEHLEIDNLLKTIQNPQEINNKIVLQTHQETTLMEVKNIVYCVGMGNYTQIVLNNGKSLTMSYNIGEYTEMLKPYNFFRIHNSFLLNYLYASKLIKKNDQPFLLLKNGETLPTSRRRKSEVLTWLTG